jgi:hypothetical protein
VLSHIVYSQPWTGAHPETGQEARDNGDGDDHLTAAGAFFFLDILSDQVVCVLCMCVSLCFICWDPLCERYRAGVCCVDTVVSIAFALLGCDVLHSSCWSFSQFVCMIGVRIRTCKLPSQVNQRLREHELFGNDCRVTAAPQVSHAGDAYAATVHVRAGYNLLGKDCLPLPPRALHSGDAHAATGLGINSGD